MLKIRSVSFSFATLAMLALLGTANAGLAVPKYDSRPDAAYTLYLDFGGFDYNGAWAGRTPGSTPAYDSDGNASSFSARELNDIQKIWARTAEKYTAFNINVTTVDPAASGLADASRQSYYDNTARVMHTVVGGDGSWIGGGGYSYVGTMKNSSAQYGALNGAHTNWVFANLAPEYLQFVAEATAHENGHGLGLNHQSDLTVGSGQDREYSLGDNAHDGQSSVAPVMGVS